jgi:DNA helicase-2/ATP-dependent DNA helicase PcrA
VEKPPYRVYTLKPQGERSGTIDYDACLNAEQREAVFALEGPVLAIAGAGTGKTRTLIYRVARILELGTPPDRVVLLTFTRRAAQEMIGRVSQLLGKGCEGIAAGTFHAFAMRTLRRYPPDGYPNEFTILDRSDTEETIQLVRGERGIAPGEKRFPKRGTLAEIFSKVVNLNRSIERIVQDEYPQFAPHTEEILAIASRYAVFKQRHGLMDYDDLLVFMASRLREPTKAQADLRAWFRYVLVDEYQDTNQLQAEITDLLAADHRNLMAVGDDSQSIYAFRGADYRNILEFPVRYPDARVIKLEQNYRSTQDILNVTNAVIRVAKVGFPKHLVSQRQPGERPAVVMTQSDPDQASFLAQRVLELREEGFRLDEMAVLFRSAFHSYELELELGRRDIPYVKYGGFRFLEAAHIKDVLAHLRVLANPEDALSWNRVLCLLPGVGPRRAIEIRERARGGGNPYRLASPGARGATAAAMGRLQGLFTDLAIPTLSPSSSLARVVSYYEPLLEQRFDDHPRRRTDLEHLQVLAEGYTSLATLLADMSLEPPDRSVKGQLSTGFDEEERLVLSTIHSAKGMEWRAVFIISALEGYFPSLWSTEHTDELEEERRLFYVATTRAKDLLYVTYPVGLFHPSSGRYLTKPSRFLDDVPAPLLDRWAVSR